MSRRTVLGWVRRVAILVLTALILAGPSLGRATVKAHQSDLDVLVAIDRTRSMIADDGPGGRSRFDQVKADLRALARAAPGVHLGVVTFGGEVVRTEMPFTTDTTAFDGLLSTLKVEGAFDGVGSRVDAPVDELESDLEEDATSRPDQRRLLILLTDGENTAGGTQRSFDDVGDLISGGAVLGYGTTAGGRMPISDDGSGDGYMTDANGRTALSHLDPDNLRTIADQLGVGYLHRDTTSTRPITDLVRSWRGLRVERGSAAEADARDAWAYAIALVPLLIWELWALSRRVREVGEFDRD